MIISAPGDIVKSQERGTRSPAAGRSPLAAAAVEYFLADPFRRARVERVAEAIGASAPAALRVLDELTELGLLRHERAPGGEVYFLRPADSFLAILEGLASFYSDQLESVAISPERAQLATGESTDELASLRALRARVASLESANDLLQRKNLELSFLYETSALLASSIDPSTLAQSTLDAVAGASHAKARRYFVTLLEGQGFSYQGGVGVDAKEAAAATRRQLALLRRCADHGEVVSIPSTGLPDPATGAQPVFVALPMAPSPSESALGCIVITETGRDGLNSEDLRLLTLLAELAGRGFANAALFTESVAMGVTDELTGMYNRRYLFRRLAEETKRARRLGGALSLIVLDLDRFKAVNDRYGHPEGDRLLRAVARTVHATVRDIDIVTRYGGEEFAVILPGAKNRHACTIAERVRRAVGALQFKTVKGVPLPITVSCGVASLDAESQSPSQLIAAADSCLLEAKRTGRDRTVCAPA